MVSMTVRPAIPDLDVDPFSDESLRDPYEYQRRLRDAGPVVHIPAYGIYAMGRFSDVQATFKDWDHFISSQGVGIEDVRKKFWRTPSLLLETDPPAHTDFRKVMGKVISPGAVRELRERFSAEAEQLVDELLDRGSFDAITEVAQRYPLMVFPRAVGLRPGGREELLAYGAISFNALGPENEHRTKALAMAGPVSKWVEDSCRREELLPEGFGASIWAAADRGELDPSLAPLLTRSLLSAGIDTTVTAIGNALYAFASHPDQWAMMHEDPHRVRVAFNEVLRWESPVQSFFRTTAEAATVGDVAVPPDVKVLLSIGSANRDERKWGPDAHVFDVRRQSGGHVAFGSGIHLCVGQPIARMEAEIVLGELAKRVARIELTAEPVANFNNLLKSWHSVPVRVTPA
jgi:cytochrome P450